MQVNVGIIELGTAAVALIGFGWWARGLVEDIRMKIRHAARNRAFRKQIEEEPDK